MRLITVVLLSSLMLVACGKDTNTDPSEEEIDKAIKILDPSYDAEASKARRAKIYETTPFKPSDGPCFLLTGEAVPCPEKKVKSK